jgi:citrate:succinate antiporter/L-tartrate/succinate antiporter
MTSRWRSSVPLLVWLILASSPKPSGLTLAGWRYHALFVAVVAALILEPLPAPVTGLIGVTLAAGLGYISPDPAESIRWALSGFSDPTVWLIFGALVISVGYEKTGLGRRIALSLVRTMGRRTVGLGYAVMLADLLLAPFTPSNTGRSAGVIYPIVRGIPSLYGSHPGPTSRRIGGYLLWTAFASTAVTSSLFLTALAPNLLAVAIIRRETGIDITWTRWFLGILPIGVLLIAPLPLLVRLIYPPEIRTSVEIPAWADAELHTMGKPTAKEGMMAGLVILALCLWVLGSDRINATTVVLAVVSLMVLGRVVDWADVVGNHRAWDTLLYFATLLTLADGLNRTGVIAWAAGGVSSVLKGFPPLMIMAALVTFFFLVHYLFASLTAHTTAVLPALLATGVAVPGMPVGVFAMLLAYSIGMMGVITPYATGPAPVYFGSGYIPRKDFWILGLVFGLIFLGTLLMIGVPYLLWLGV